MRRALIRVEGHQKIGTGHVFRCLALAHYLKAHFELIFVMESKEPSLVEAISSAGFKLQTLSSSSLDDFLGLIQEDDLVVLDGYGFDQNYQASVRARAFRTLVIDDFNSGTYDCDYLLNHANSFTSDSYRIRNGKALVGSDYALLHPAFIEAIENECPWSGKANKIVLSLGGADEHNYSLAVLGALEPLGLETHVLVGPSNPHFETLQKSSNSAQIHRAMSQQQLIKFFQESDLVICSPSTMATEVCALRRPMGLAAFADNQLAIGQSFHQIGAARYFGDLRSLSSQDIQSQLQSFCEDSELSFMVENQRKLVDGKSPQRIIQALSIL